MSQDGAIEARKAQLSVHIIHELEFQIIEDNLHAILKGDSCTLMELMRRKYRVECEEETDFLKEYKWCSRFVKGVCMKK